MGVREIDTGRAIATATAKGGGASEPIAVVAAAAAAAAASALLEFPAGRANGRSVEGVVNKITLDERTDGAGESMSVCMRSEAHVRACEGVCKGVRVKEVVQRRMCARGRV